MVDATDSKSVILRCGSSSLFKGTHLYKYQKFQINNIKNNFLIERFSYGLPISPKFAR